MRFIVDECTGPAVARWLIGRGYDVFSVFDEARGISDDEVIGKAVAEKRIVITNDKDFGEKVYRDRKSHSGIILLRLSDERAANKIATLEKFFDEYRNQITGFFIVVSEDRVKFSRR